MSQATVPFPHPLLGCLDEIGSALDEAVGCNPVYLTTDAKAEALVGLSREIARLEGLRLKVLAVAHDVADQTGARSAGAWLAHATRIDGAAGRRLERLAEALDERYAATGAAVLDGRVNLAQAEVIVAALDELPTDLDADLAARAQAQLVEYAADFEPKRLRVLARKVLEVIAPEAAEDHVRKALEAEERRARAKMRITTRDLGNGLCRAVVDLPRVSMDLWLTQLHAFASPRRAHLDETLAGETRIDPDTGERVRYSQLLAQAFCTMLERSRASRSPRHGGTAATLMVTIDLDKITQGLGSAELSTGGVISAGEARRLACNAQIIPVVLGGQSEVLDLGRAKRFFSPAQRKAMALRDRGCRTESCDIPAAWAEAHHLRAWSSNGPTNIDDGILLCSFHHHKAHDKRYDMHRMPSGDVRFNRRR